MRCLGSNLCSLFQAVDGCYDKLLELIENNAVVIAGVALGIVALEVQKTPHVT